MVIFTTLLKPAERTCQICPRRTVAPNRMRSGTWLSIFGLFRNHRIQQRTLNHSIDSIPNRDELKHIRTNLSHRLHELKVVLSRPGRAGAWSSFLASQKIPRSTADRLVRTHEKTLNPDGENCATEQISEPPEVTVRRCFHALWPKLSRVLTTRESVELFITELRRTADKSFGVEAEASSSSLPSSAALSGGE